MKEKRDSKRKAGAMRVRAWTLPGILQVLAFSPYSKILATDTQDLFTQSLYKCIVAGFCVAILAGIVLVFVLIVRPRKRLE